MKKIIAILLTVVMSFLFVACNSDANAPETDSSASVAESAENSENSAEVDVETVNIGDTLKTDFMEMTFDGIQVTERLKCSVNSRGDNIILGEVVDGKKVAYFSGEIKNIHTDTIGNTYRDNDCIWGVMRFDDKYNYEFKMYIQNGENMEGTISPFSTGTYYLYAHIPNELLETYSTCTLNFGFCENLEAYDSSYNGGFSYEECEYKYSLTVTK